MIPVLLNLKGNLEMGLAARLSTAANKHEEMGMRLALSSEVVLGNVLLVQFQAIVTGLLVGALSVFLGFAVHHERNSLSETLLIVACSSLTALLSSALTSGLLAVIIVKSRQAGINPDNISTPLANCLGDLSTMCLLAVVAKLLYALAFSWVSGALVVLSIGVGLVFFALLLRNSQVRPLLYSGWTPILGAIAITSVAGLAFERFVRYFEGLGLILTVVNGVCGNTSSILAARMATSLQLGSMEADVDRHRSSKRTLFVLCTPIHLIFLLLLYITGLGHTSITPIYAVGHLVAVNLQLAFVMVWSVPNLVRFLWKRGCDPDTYTMPLLAACSDLSGTFVFILTFSLLWLLGDRDANVGT